MNDIQEIFKELISRIDAYELPKDFKFEHSEKMIFIATKCEIKSIIANLALVYV